MHMKMDGTGLLAKEASLRNRLQHVQFKRISWMFETAVLAFIVAVAFLTPMPFVLQVLLVLGCALRMITEALNHRHITQLFNVADRWQLMYPFV